MGKVAPVRERGLKYNESQYPCWLYPVAPVRERGLKCRRNTAANRRSGRSREGAWIEIAKKEKLFALRYVAPVRERGLKCRIKNQIQPGTESRSREGAWIEIYRPFPA